MQEAAQQQNTSQPTSYFISEFPIYNFPNHLFDDLMALEPYGNGHPKPSFRSKTYLHVDTPALGKTKNMLNSFFKKRAYAYSHGHLFQNWNRYNRMDVLYTPHSYEKQDFLINDLQLIQ